jgi:uncharacterized membrane protein
MMSDAPANLYIATYPDPGVAQEDWDNIKQLAHDKVITLDGLVLVSRDADGKIEVKDNASDVGKGAVWGLVGGAVVGLIFPPALLVSAAVGAGIGAGTGAILDHNQKEDIKADVEDVLPPGSSGIVALSRRAGWMTSRRRLRRPTRSPSTKSTAKAPSRSRQPRPARPSSGCT